MSFEGLIQLLSEGGFKHLSRQACEDSAREGCPLCKAFCELPRYITWTGTRLLFLSLNLHLGISTPDRTALLSDYFDKPVDMVAALARARNPWNPSLPSELRGRLEGGEVVFSTKVFTTESRSSRIAVCFTPQSHAADGKDALTADPAARFIVPRPMPGYPDDGELAATAKAWMEDCRCNHVGTCPSNTGVALPSRLIDVGDDSIAPDVRLRISGQGEAGEYTALSYCWGGPQPVTATLDKLDSMRQKIVLSDLPQTLQDAIRVTRSVGQRYLWVDALCIIQDSDEDKQREIQKMGSIYKNAMLTISAAAASAVSEGFLGRQPEPLPSLKWQFDVPDVGTHTIFVSLHDNNSTYQPDHPLDRRGWALQESLLSPRRLVFSEHEPIWHCQTARWKTAVEDSYLKYLDHDPRLPHWIFTDSADSVNLRTTSKEQQELWARIVERFTQGSLTNKEDRLNAVAGIAAELQRRWKDDYLYGHWGRCFIEQLAWERARGKPLPGFSGERSSRAPTWSWASLDCAVSYAKIDKVQATVEITSTTHGFPCVFLTCKTKKLEDIPDGYRHACSWDTTAQASRHGAVLMLLGTYRMGFSLAAKAICIIGIPSSGRRGVYQRIGLFAAYLYDGRWTTLWEAVEPEQILLE
jgi:hypothetical protein